MRPLRFGIVRNLDMAKTRAMLAEFCDLMSTAAGAAIHPHHALTYRELADSTSRGDLALAWMPPVLCAEMMDAKTCQVLAIPVRRASTSYYSAFIARADAKIDLAIAQGLRAAWVEPESSGGHLVMRLHLEALGHDLAKLIARESFVHSHDGVVEAVLVRRADVGATYCAVAPGTTRIETAPWRAKASDAEISVLALAGPIPNDSIVTTNAITPQIRKNLLTWILHPEDRARALFRELFGADGFREATASHFMPLQRTIAKAKARHGQR